MATPSVPPKSGEPPLVAGRYTLEALLGKGGAGEVWRVRDASTGQHRAMKILKANATAKQVALFEREYHTLAGLRHPHIIEAYDYGTHGDSPFYTMEILEGADMTAVAPMPWRDACRVLRDVASALALLHARKLLHRDVSARNVWRTHEGHIKLLDFGALTSFGSAGDITGTPPFVAPEALRGQVLDQRTDLYAAGALGYFLLTGRHAYPAHSFRELQEMWQHTPPAPSTLVRALGRADLPEIPAELDLLIESLLRRDLRARPTNAPELIDRLIAVASLEPDARVSAAYDYLQSTLFVGRARERSELRAALKRVAQGAGSCALIEGAPGMGRSRLLSEVALDAQLTGATVLHLEARGYEGVNAVALALANKLLDALPREARELSAAHARILGHLSPELCERLGRSPADLESMPVTPGEARMRIQAALREWFLAVSRKNALAVLIDDLEAVDEGSAAFLAALGRQARYANVLVVCTLRRGERELGSAAQVFRQFATTHKLSPLKPEETLELLRSLFGDTPNLARLAERLHRVSQGNPDHLMHLAEYLVRKGLVACHDGTWVLPFDLDLESLPATRTEAWSAQLMRLSEDARALVQALSVEDGLIPIEVCGAILDMEPAAAFAALGELERGGLLARSPGGYLFVDEAFRDALRASLSPERARAAHRRFGEVGLAASHRSGLETLKAGLHLLCGGEESQGGALIAASLSQGSGDQVRVMDPTEIAQMAPILERALATFQAQGRSDYQRVMLTSTLASLGYYADRKYAERYGDRAVSMLGSVLELSLIRRASALLGRKLGLFLGLAVAALRIRRARRKDSTVPEFRECVRLLLSCIGALTGVATICIDPRKAMSLARVVEPFTALGKNHAATVVHEFCMNLAATVQDRVGETHARWERMLARLRSKVPIKGMNEEFVTLYRAGALYALGVIETWRDGPRALEIAEELESLGMKLYQMSADQLRMVYYANQGNMEFAERYRERVEMHAIQRGTAWQVETWAPGAMITVYLRTLDARGMKHCVEQLRQLQNSIPSMTVYAARSRGVYLLLREKYEQALEWLGQALHEEPLAVAGWARGHGALARAHNALGQYEQARNACRAALDKMTEADLSFPAPNLVVELELAVAEAGLGDHAGAREQIAALLAKHSPGEGPLTLGAIHEAGLRIETLAADTERALSHLVHMERWYRRTGIPTLIEHCERLSRAHRPPEGAGSSSSLGAFGEAHDLAYRVRHGGTGTSRTGTLERALSQLLEVDEREGGFILLKDATTEREVIHLAGGAPPDAVVDWARRRLEEESEFETHTTVVGELAEVSERDRFTWDGTAYRLAVLRTKLTARTVTLGVFVVASERDVVPVFALEVLRALADRLCDTSSLSLP